VALNSALADGRLSPLAVEDDDEINGRMEALHAERAYLPILNARVRKNWVAARDQALARNPVDDAYALDIGRGLGWGFVADIESLLTALYSTLDVATGLAVSATRSRIRCLSAARCAEILQRFAFHRGGALTPETVPPYLRRVTRLALNAGEATFTRRGAPTGETRHASWDSRGTVPASTWWPRAGQASALATRSGVF
jgi:hypothetical protein